MNIAVAIIIAALVLLSIFFEMKVTNAIHLADWPKANKFSNYSLACVLVALAVLIIFWIVTP